jgi:iron complex outermembrane receptor protein
MAKWLLLILAGICIAREDAAGQGVQDLSLEELMEVDAGRVFAASERMQPVTEAPASVSFITAEEIARYGYKTLADILHGVRGMYVTDDRNFSYVGIRGFGKPGDYNSRILLLVNGHRVNDNVFGQAEIGAEFGLDPATFERIEVIRGPASSLYGDSAFFAVVNVITRTGASLGGTTASLESGSFGTTVTRASVGHQYNSGLDVALAGTLERSDGVARLYYPEFDSPSTNNGIASGLDGQRVGQFYGRLQFGDFALTGAYGRRQKDVPTASFGTVFNEQQFNEETTDRHTLVDAEYGITVGESRIVLRGSFDRFTYDGVYPLASEDVPSGMLVGLSSVVGNRWTIGARITRALSRRHTLTAGAEHINNTKQHQDSRFVDPALVLFSLDRPSQQSAAYAQHELKLYRSLIFTTGLRYDGYEQFSRVTPRTAVIWMPLPNQSFKYLYGHAFRAPNAHESNSFYFGDAVLDLRPETISTHEVVWERYASDWLRTSVSTYWYDADRLITLHADPAAFLGATFVNAGQVRAKGLELEAQLRGKWRLQGMFSYALQQAIDQDTGAPLPNSPRHMLKGRVSMPLVSPRSSIGLEVIAVGSRLTLAGTPVPRATTADLTLSHPLSPSFELFGTFDNVFNVQYADPGSGSLRQNVIPRNGRALQIGLRWKLADN